MAELGTQVLEFFQGERATNAIQALLLLIAGLVLARLSATGIARVLREHVDPHQLMIARRLSYFLVLGLFIASALHQLGFRMTLLLGAAGVLSVAVGFASQTSASNLVSGLFLLSERPFAVGDVIRIGGATGTTGEVVSVDLLSAKLRTFENIFVRIPNETLIKSEVANLTRYPIRRMDLTVPVAYSSRLREVREALLEVVRRDPLCLDEPEPLFIFRGFGDSALDLQFSVWTRREHFVKVKSELLQEIHVELESRGIEIPFPQRTVHLHSPLPAAASKSEVDR